MRFVNPIPFVSDIEESTRFYRDLLGLRVLEDHGDFIMFETGFAIHDGAALARTVWGSTDGIPSPFGRNNVLYYFEEDDIETAFAKIAPEVRLIHPIQRQAWGQHVFRFYDPDGHAIEIGEPQGPNETA